MGCCGCALYGSAITAGVLGIIQSVIYIIMSIPVAIIHYSYSRYYDSRHWLAVQNPEQYHIDFIGFLRINTAVKTMVVVTMFFNVLWLASSIALLVSNVKRKPNANGVLQWTVITSIMTACEILFTFYLISIGSDQIKSGYPDFYRSFFFLDLASVSRGYGVLFGWCFNIPLTVFVYKRYQEIRKMKLARAANADTVPLNPQPEGQVFPNNQFQIQMQQRPYAMVPIDCLTQPPPQWVTGPYNPQYPGAQPGFQPQPYVYPNAPHDVGLNGQPSLDSNTECHETPLVKGQA